MGSNSAITSGDSYNRESGAPCVFLRAAIFYERFCGRPRARDHPGIILNKHLVSYLLPPKMDDHLKLSLAVCSACVNKNMHHM